MSSRNGKIPGTYVSQEELNDLGKLLHTLRDYIVSHEARIELIEGWINEYMEAHAPTAPEVEEVETDGIEEAEIAAAEGGAKAVEEHAEALRLLRDSDESTDDSEER